MYCYLDNSATTPVLDSIKAVVEQYFNDGFYNPSSLYTPSVKVSGYIEECRKYITDLLGAKRLIFTSGGTESNNIAILGYLMRQRKKGTVLYSAVEHPAVINACLEARRQGFNVQEIKVNRSGIVDLDLLQKQLNSDVQLICVMHVNNETGAIQPINEISKLRDRYCSDAFFHVDGVQSFMRQPINLRIYGIDSYSLSGHKIHAFKGIGALALGERNKAYPLVFGGGQEYDIRPGTENTLGIASLYEAAKQFPEKNNMRENKIRLYNNIKKLIPSVKVNGPEPQSPEAADNILNLSFAPVRAETMLHALESDEIYVGNGSACSSRKSDISHVLKAMGIEKEQATCAIRFSLSPFNTAEQMDFASECCLKHYNILKKFTRR
ncbi:MAG TPA: cysteine desulfurase [Christensenellaceae bacterium]|jgi:cysteine desulfurase|nr:cysteine desulfurase [Christensenellaceae bacterium]